MALGQASYTRDFSTDVEEGRDGCHPTFHLMSEEIIVDGEKRFRDVEMVKIFMPGNSQTLPDIPVTDVERKRWPRQYAAFKDGLSSPVMGTPLEGWHVLTPAQLDTLKSLKFRTIEDIADMSEVAIHNIGMGARQLKLKAIAYLDRAEKDKITNKAIDDAEKFKQLADDMKAQNDRLNEQLAELGRQVQQMSFKRDYDAQNIASTPVSSASVQPNYQQTVAAPFASFAALAAEEPVPVPQDPPGEQITVAPPSPRRGRPTNAERAARGE